MSITSVIAQDSIPRNKNNNEVQKGSVSPRSHSKKYVPTERNISNYKQLEEAIQDNNDEKKYNEYINLADKLTKEKKYQEANNYLNKALEYFTQQKNKKKQSEIHRKLAFNNEQLKNEKEARIQYQKAKDVAPTPQISNSIQRDLDRVEVSSQPQAKEQQIEQHIQSLEASQDINVLNQSYRQLADVALQNKDTAKAITALIKSSKTVTDEIEKIELQDQLADIYASSDSINKAIQVTHEARNLAYQQKDWSNYVNQTLKLSEYYLQAQANDSAEWILKTTLEKAYTDHNTQAILVLVKALKDYYIQNGRPQNIEAYIDTLLNNLWQIALVDTNIYQDALYNEVTSRIALLEKDKESQRLLYERTQLFNTILIGVSFVLLMAIIFIILSLSKLKKKNYLIQLQSLRKEMNPHFIFNALNSVNLFIAQNDEIAANKYLTSYSSLMRNILTTSNKNFITLQEEIVALRDYIELEHMRFEEHFDYDISFDDALKDDIYWIPNMLIQPFVENAIWHGLRYKPTKGILQVKGHKLDDRIQVIIEDDGIGYEHSQKIKSKNQKSHQSIGIYNTQERIRLLNILFGMDITYMSEPVDVVHNSGHRVILSWLIKNDNNEYK